MQIKRFTAETMREALKLVKDEFGPEAVILSARSLKKPNPLLGPWSKDRVEVSAAKEAPRGFRDPGHSAVSSKPAVPPAFREPVRLAGPVDGHPKQVGVPPTPGRFLPPSHIKKLFVLYRLMRCQGVDRCVALHLVKQVYTRAALETDMTDSDLQEILKRIVQRHLRVLMRRTAMASEPGGIVVVGPTGVGKTTTVAKLAAIQSRARGRSVGLITLDSHRIGGAAQLEIFSRILELPLVSAPDPGEFRRAIRCFEDADSVLIDTAGFHPRQVDQMTALQQMLGTGCSYQVHLVLSAGSACNELLEIIDGYRCLPIHRLIITKLDEAVHSGNLLNLIIRKRIPISFLCNGPRVPEDIQTANAARIIDFIIRPELEERIWSAPPEDVARQIAVFENYLQRASDIRRLDPRVAPDRRLFPVVSSDGAAEAPWRDPEGRSIGTYERPY